MSIFPINPALAAKAYKLAKQGLKGKAIAEKLGKGITTGDANILASVGRCAAHEEFYAMSDRERDVLLALAAITRENRLRGDTASTKAKWVARRLRLSDGQVRRITKRLGVAGYAAPGDGVHLGLLEHSVNGHIWLLPAGWAVVSAMEGEAAKARRNITAAIDKLARTADCGCQPCYGHPEREAAYEECAAIAAKVPA